MARKVRSEQGGLGQERLVRNKSPSPRFPAALLHYLRAWNGLLEGTRQGKEVRSAYDTSVPAHEIQTPAQLPLPLRLCLCFILYVMHLAFALDLKVPVCARNSGSLATGLRHSLALNVELVRLSDSASLSAVPSVLGLVVPSDCFGHCSGSS